MIQSGDGSVLVTNDGATILSKMRMQSRGKNVGWNFKRTGCRSRRWNNKRGCLMITSERSTKTSRGKGSTHQSYQKLGERLSSKPAIRREGGCSCTTKR